MERLQSLLKTYNQSHPEDNLLAPWNQQYCQDVFPKYWETTYAILESLEKNWFFVFRLFKLKSELVFLFNVGLIPELICFFIFQSKFITHI
jgi:hypothetical protein